LTAEEEGFTADSANMTNENAGLSIASKSQKMPVLRSLIVGYTISELQAIAVIHSFPLERLDCFPKRYYDGVTPI
jgi:hypothetical protein